MKQNYYIVTFTNGKTVFVFGFNTEEAEILAKAVMINNGLSYEVENIKVTNDLFNIEDTDFVA